ncbi:MAG: outer membrane beta-barrel protein [Desulfobulbaceae bacterium]|nr:outer membrane beta-barrel protein [Desulfobulbaceae bacterium]
MKMKHLAFTLVTAVLALGAVGAAQAADPMFVVKVGIADVEPKSDNGALAGYQSEISNSVRPSITGEYMITPELGIELLAAWPFHNDVKLASVGTVGGVDVLPPTLSLQYHFLPNWIVSPFVGAGINYTFIYNARAKGIIEGHDLGVDNSWGFAAHAGVDFNLPHNWLITADIRWIQMGGDVTLDGEKIGSVNINPWVWGLSVGYRF